jgi:hypothetical protein
VSSPKLTAEPRTSSTSSCSVEYLMEVRGERDIVSSDGSRVNCLPCDLMNSIHPVVLGAAI